MHVTRLNTKKCSEDPIVNIIESCYTDVQFLRLGDSPSVPIDIIPDSLELLRDDFQPLNDEREVLHADHCDTLHLLRLYTDSLRYKEVR